MVIQKMVDWYKSWGFCGWFRFRTLWFAHRFIRNSGLAEQWDFVLKYISYTKQAPCFHPRTLDIGTYGSLFIYELKHRGYITQGIDKKGFHVNLPKYNSLGIGVGDILDEDVYPDKLFKIITMISVLQYVDDQKLAIKNIHKFLCPNGIFLLTVPQNEFNYLQLKKLTEPYFEILEYQPCRGHLGMAFMKK